MRITSIFLVIIILSTAGVSEAVANCIKSQAGTILKEDTYLLKPERRRTRRIRGKRQIKDLKEGMLLVRLKTSEKKIAAFEKRGDFVKAEKVKNMQRLENLEIVDAFKNYYNYSKVYFFFANETERILEGQWNGVFLNDSLLRDPSINPEKTSKWFIGEFDYLETDTARHWERSYYNRDTKRLEPVYWGTSADYYRRSFVVRDQNQIQLKRPFPYYVSCKTEETSDPAVLVFNASLKRSITETVNTFDRKLKKKLKRFYNISP